MISKNFQTHFSLKKIFWSKIDQHHHIFFSQYFSHHTFLVNILVIIYFLVNILVINIHFLLIFIQNICNFPIQLPTEFFIV
jgi:hypothetical protein